MIKNFLNEYFNYSKQENRGIIVLIILIIIIFFIPFFIKKQITRQKQTNDYSEFAQKVEKIVGKQSESSHSVVNKIGARTKKVEYFCFDPNTVSKLELKKMGFTEKQSLILINYRKNGGIFKKKSDLKKIYGITDELYSEVETYITIKKDKTKTLNIENKKRETVKPVKLSIEINTADTTELMKLSGIGEVFSKRIVNYRDFLGGFFDKTQLLEVYGIKKETYEKVKDNIFVDTTDIKKININKADFKTIAKHPYLSYADTKRIIKFREISGNFTNVSQLKTNNLVDLATYNKIRHYIVTE